MRAQTENIDYTDKDYESFRNAMIQDLKIKMPEYTDTRESDAGIVIIELLAKGLDVLSYYQDVNANETFLVTQEQRDNAIKWSNMLGYFPRNSSPSRFSQVFKLNIALTEDFTIPKGTLVSTAKTQSEEVINFETLTDLVIPKGVLGDEQDSLGNYLYTVEVVQGISVSSELVGTSNGLSNQTFLLNYTPVIVDSVTLYINEGDGFNKWTRVNSFIDSKSTDKHFIVQINNNDEAIISFGDNIFGKIPTVYKNGIYCDYRIGGGTIGNVSPNKITVINQNMADVNSTFNPYEAIETGKDKETLQEIKNNAPVVNRNVWGALTAKDFAEVVLANFSDVQFAESQVDTVNIDDIHIYLLLKNNMELTQDFKNLVLDFFDENKGGRKIVGSNEIFIEGASLVELDFDCNLVVSSGYNRVNIENSIKDFLTYYFAIGSYPFNTELSLTELASQIMQSSNIQGIKSFRFVTPLIDILVPSINEIYTLGSVTFSSSTGGI